MSLILAIIINLIILFIAFVVLNSRIRKTSTATLLEQYTREVENLIVQLNAAVDDVVNVAEEHIDELKEVIERAEKLIKDPKTKRLLPAQKKSAQRARTTEGKVEIADLDRDRGNLVERTKHLLSMGHTKEEIAEILSISRAEVDFLESLSRK
jgi:F0F1-type ATP synthase membrane subunit b/b'